MDGAALERYQTILKEFLLPAMIQQFPDINPLFDRITRSSQHVEGKWVKGVAHYGRAIAGGARHDDEATPTADYQKAAEFKILIPGNYWTIELTDQLIEASASDRGAYARSLAFEMERAFADFRRDLNRQLHGIGEGVLAKWRSGDDPTSGSGYTFESRYTGAGTGRFGDTFGTKYIDDGAKVNVIDRGGTATVYGGSSGYTVSSTDKVNHTAKLDSDPGYTEAVPDYLTRALSYADGIGTSSFKKREMMGLSGIVHDNDVDTRLAGASVSHPLQDLDVSTYPWWAAKVFAHSSGRGTAQRELTEALLARLVDYQTEIQGIRPTILWTTLSIIREFAYGEMFADRRFVNTVELKAGVKVPAFLDIPIWGDADMIDGEMFALYEPELTIQQMSDIGWLDKDGKILHKKSGYSIYEATLKWYAELVTFRRNAHAALVDLSYTPYT